MPIIEALLAQGDRDRKNAVTHEHPVYEAFKDAWDVLANAYDGTGGFKDGSYLYKFPREDDDKYTARTAQARYHNYVESLVELFTRYLTRSVTRETDSEDLADWWLDVDGRGTSIDDMIRDVVALALSSGHVGALIDKPTMEPGETRSEDTQPFVSLYAPLAIQDWILDARAGLRAVKLREAVTPVGFEDDADDQYLIWDDEMWARFDIEGVPIPEQAGAHELGRVPFEVFRPKRMKRHPFIGKPLISAHLVLAIFNRASEEDEVLRNQAFSQLIVSLPNDADADAIRQAQDLISSGGGTQKALVVPGTARYETPDMATAEAIRTNQEFLVREIYRMAHVPFRQDTREVESADAIRLQHQELNELLRGMANDLTQFEQNIARHYFGWQSTSPERADAAMEAANVSVQYPTEFFTRSLAGELEEWATAVAFGLGPTAEKAIKRRVAARVLEDADVETAEAIDAEIEAGAGQPGGRPGEQLRQSAQARLSALVEEDAA